MKSPRFLFLIIPLFIFGGCSLSRESQRESARSAAPAGQTKTLTTSEGFVANDKLTQDRNQNPTTAQVSLKQADQAQSLAEAMNRKIIRDADLTLEVGAPAEAQRKITSMAETLGGFVVTSESKQRQIGDAKQELEVNLVVRVPATQFGAALDRASGETSVRPSQTASTSRAR